MKKVVLVDDDPGIQDAARMILEHEGYAVTVYSSGYPLLNQNIELPDIFILDKQLSGIDGLDLCRHLKKQETTNNIPVIMLSASPNISKLYSEAGANDFLEKPFKMKDLRAIVAKYTGEE